MRAIYDYVSSSGANELEFNDDGSLDIALSDNHLTGLSHTMEGADVYELYLAMRILFEEPE
jgi:hypothetical protein